MSNTQSISATMNVTDVKWKTVIGLSPFYHTYRQIGVTIQRVTDEHDFTYEGVSINSTGASLGDPGSKVGVEYQQNSVAGPVMFTLETINVPVGSYVAFACDTQGPSPPIQLSKSVVQQIGQSFGIQSNVPGDFKGTIEISFWPNGTKPEKDVALEFMAIHQEEEKEKLSISRAVLLCKILVNLS
jgi:hypothetical protein